MVTTGQRKRKSIQMQLALSTDTVKAIDRVDVLEYGRGFVTVEWLKRWTHKPAPLFDPRLTPPSTQVPTDVPLAIAKVLERTVLYYLTNAADRPQDVHVRLVEAATEALASAIVNTEGTRVAWSIRYCPLFLGGSPRTL